MQVSNLSPRRFSRQLIACGSNEIPVMNHHGVVLPATKGADRRFTRERKSYSRLPMQAPLFEQFKHRVLLIEHLVQTLPFSMCHGLGKTTFTAGEGIVALGKKRRRTMGWNPSPSSALPRSAGGADRRRIVARLPIPSNFSPHQALIRLSIESSLECLPQ